MMAAPSRVKPSGRVFQISQSIATPQARAVYSKGATTEASPWLKASVMASWAPKPLTASAPSSGRWRACTGNQPGAASSVAPIAIISISQNTMCSLRSLRASTRPATADTA